MEDSNSDYHSGSSPRYNTAKTWLLIFLTKDISNKYCFKYMTLRLADLTINLKVLPLQWPLFITGSPEPYRTSLLSFPQGSSLNIWKQQPYPFTNVCNNFIHENMAVGHTTGIVKQNFLNRSRHSNFYNSYGTTHSNYTSSFSG